MYLEVLDRCFALDINFGSCKTAESKLSANCTKICDKNKYSGEQKLHVFPETVVNE